MKFADKMLKELISTLIFTSLATAIMAQELITENGKVYKLYTVEKSEGLYRISLNNNVSQEEIIAVNPEIQQTGLVEGMTIKIPIKMTEMKVSEVGYSVYIVGKGETAYSISKKFDMQLIDLYKLNPGIESGVTEGQKLKVRGSANEARSYNIHTIAAGETLYSIGVKYGVKAQQIIDCNPSLNPSSLPIGTQLRIPDTQIPIEDDNFFYHRIEQGETLYALCNKYNILQDKIEEANVNINWQSLQVGQVIAIPKVNKKQPSYIEHEVKKRETLYSISKQYNVSIADIENANKEINLSNLQKGQKIHIPTLVEQIYTGPATNNPDYVGEDNTNEYENLVYSYRQEGSPIINVALMLPFNAESEIANRKLALQENQSIAYTFKSRRYIEFYEGVKLAVDSFVQSGANIKLHVYDINTNLALANALNNNDINFDLILGPAHLTDMKTISDYAMRNHVPAVFPFAQMDSTIRENPYIFQASVIDTITIREIAEEMIKDCKDKHLILLNPRQEKSDLYKYNLIRNLAKQNNVDISLCTFNAKQSSAFLALLKTDKENVIILPTTNEALVNTQIVSISGIIDQKKDVAISLYGVGEWLKFSTIEVDVFHKLNTAIYSTFALDYNDAQTRWTINKYRKENFCEPVAFTPYFQNFRQNVYSGYSEYSLWGYDIALKFIGARVKFGKDFIRKINEYKVPTTQTNFVFKPLTNWGGCVNVGLKRIVFNSDNTIKVVDIQQE